MTNEVQDKPVELYIKILTLLAVITLPAFGTIGTMLISGQRENTAEIRKMASEMADLSKTFSGQSVQINQNKEDVHRIDVKLDKTIDRVYTLEGAYKSWKK